MGVGAGLSMYVVVVQKFTFAISSPDEFLLGLAFNNGWQHGKADGHINTRDVLPTSRKNLVNFGPLSP